MIRKTILRNTSLGMVSQGTGIVLAVLITPFTIHHLGLSTYGLWILVSSVVGYLGLTDFGLRPAIGRFIALHLAKNEQEEINVIAATSLISLTVSMLVIWSITLFAPFVFLHLFNLDGAQEQTAKILLWIIGLSIGLGLPLSVFDALLIGAGRYDITYAIDIAIAVVKAGVTIILLSLGYGVVSLVVSNLIFIAVAGCTQLIFAYRIFPNLRLAISQWKFNKLQELYKLGRWSFINTIWYRLAFTTDNVVIGYALNTEAVAVYSIAGRLISYALTGADSFSTVLMPHATALHAQENVTRQIKLLYESTKGSLLYAMFVGVIFWVYGHQVIVFWVGPKFGTADGILKILLLPMLSFIGAKTASVLLFTKGEKPYRWLSLIFSIDALSNVILSLILVRFYGMRGVAYGTLFTMTVTMVVILPVYTCHVFSIKWIEYLRNTYGIAIGIGAAFFMGIWLLNHIFPVTHLLSVGLVLLVSAGVYFSLVYKYCFHQAATPKTISAS